MRGVDSANLSELRCGKTGAPDPDTAELSRSRWLPFRARVLGWSWAQALRLLTASWRVEIVGLETLDKLMTRGQPHFVAFWHRKYVALFTLLRNRRACVFTSQSDRGNILAELCRRFGFVDVQIPDHRAAQALEVMRRALPAFCEAGVAVDGPMGPYHIVKRGPVQLAAQLGWQIVPASVASRHKYVFRHRWDRLEIPKPLSRVCLKIGEPICIPSNLTTGELHHWTRRLHDILEDDEREAQRKVRSSYGATAGSLRSPHG